VKSPALRPNGLAEIRSTYKPNKKENIGFIFLLKLYIAAK
jgi:hypothetical protein